MPFHFSATRPIAVITGAARRVGRAIAIDLAAAGYDLVLTYNHSRDEIESAAEACHVAASNVLTQRNTPIHNESALDEDEDPDDGAASGADIQIALHQVDLTDEADIDKFAAWLENHLPRLDALIHNASRYTTTTWGKVTAEEALEHFQVNAVAPLLLTQAVRDPLRQSNGTVILFSDIHVLGRPRRNLAAYNLSKAAATELVHTLARELAPDVRVIGVAPGVVAWPDDAPDEEVRQYESRIPLARSGKPDDAAQLVRFLISRDAGYITGEIIRLDGGRFLN